MQHIFVDRDRPSNIIQELILRTKKAVSELDNLQYKRAKKIFIVNPSFEQPDGGDGDNDTETVQNGPDEVMEEPIPEEEPIVGIFVKLFSILKPGKYVPAKRF